MAGSGRVTVWCTMKAIVSGSSSCGMYFCCEVDGLGGAVEWADDRSPAEWRGAAERGFARLDTEGSEARGGTDAEAGEELQESGRTHTDATEEVVDVSGYVHGMGSLDAYEWSGWMERSERSTRGP